MLSAIRSTILSSLSWLPSGSAITSRNWRKRMRGPLIAKAMGPPDGLLSAPPVGAASPSGAGLVETVIGMQRPHCKLGIFLVDQDRGLDFGRGDQLDVDALFRQGPEHGGRDARVAAH